MWCRARQRVNPQHQSHTRCQLFTPAEAISISLQFGSTTPTTPSTAPLPVSTKIQKKNAKKAEAKKAAKAADEADRQRRLTMHKREIEK